MSIVQCIEYQGSTWFEFEHEMEEENYSADVAAMSPVYFSDEPF